MSAGSAPQRSPGRWSHASRWTSHCTAAGHSSHEWQTCGRKRSSVILQFNTPLWKPKECGGHLCRWNEQRDQRERKGSDGSRRCGWTEWQDERERIGTDYWVKRGNERALMFGSGLLLGQPCGEDTVEFERGVSLHMVQGFIHRKPRPTKPNTDCAPAPHATSCFDVCPRGPMRIYTVCLHTFDHLSFYIQQALSSKVTYRWMAHCSTHSVRTYVCYSGLYMYCICVYCAAL